MRVSLIARTVFDPTTAEAATGWQYVTEGYGAQDLAEFAGRACYQSWDRPNPSTNTNDTYLDHIISVQHHSVLEHGSVTFYIQDVSRSLTHELVRHRHHSPSQLSQRFVVLGAEASDDGEEIKSPTHVTPPLFREDDVAGAILAEAWTSAVTYYDQLMDRAHELIEAEDPTAPNTSRRKQAAEAARAVLPNMTPTAIVLTGNHRAWRNLIIQRGALSGPDREIRELAVELYRQLSALEPNMYQDIWLIEGKRFSWIES